MTTGAYDSTGIWQPGEDDNLSPWSGPGGYINKIPASVTAVLGGAWTAVTPTFANLTPGSGALYGRYKKVGRMVTYMGSWTFGAGSAVGTNPTLTLPVASVAGVYGVSQVLGTLSLQDSGTGWQIGYARWKTTTTAEFMAATIAGMTATAPWTWATGDTISWNLTYESAA